MSTYDEALCYGFLLGVLASVLLGCGLLIARDESARAPKLPGSPDWPETPLRPLSDDDLRMIRICESCRRYMGETRTITAGQHLNFLHDVCPRCAKRRAVVAAGVPQSA